MPSRVIGADSLSRQLKSLQVNVGSKEMRRAVNFAITPVLQQARVRAPRGKKPFKTYKGRIVAPGFLARSLQKKTRQSRDRSRAYAFVWAKPEAYYGKFVEQGHYKGARNKKTKRASRREGALSRKRLNQLGNNRTYQPPDPFLAPAFRSNRVTMLKRFSDKIRSDIQKAARK